MQFWWFAYWQALQGPFSIDGVQVFAPGAQSHQVFHAGAQAMQVGDT